MKKLLVALLATGLALAPAAALACGPDKVVVHHFTGNGECKQKVLPAQVAGNPEWIEGPCPTDPTPTPEPTETPTPEPTPTPTPEPTEPPAPAPTKHVVSHPCTVTGWSGTVRVAGVRYAVTVRVPCANSMLSEEMARRIARKYIRTGTVAGLANPETVTVVVT